MRTARQRAATAKWQAAGVAARKAKAAIKPKAAPKMGTAGETVTMFHVTSESGARGILRRGFRGSDRLVMGKVKEPVWLSTTAPDAPGGRSAVELVPEKFGLPEHGKLKPVYLKVEGVPKLRLHRDKHAPHWKFSKVASAADLKGVKVTRYHPWWESAKVFNA